MPSQQKQIGWSMFLHVLHFALAATLQLMLARWAVDSAVFGVYVFYFSLAQILAILADLGIPSAALRFISRHLAFGQIDRARRLVRRSYGMVLSSATLLGILLVAGVWLIRGGVSNLVWVTAILIPVFGLRFMNEAWAKSQHRTTLTLLPGGVLHPMLVMVGCLGLFGLNFGTVEAISLLLVAGCVVAVCSLVQAVWLARTDVHCPEKNHCPDDELEPPNDFSFRELLRVSLPMLLVAGLGIAMSQTDVIMLKWLASDAETGEYAVAVRISWLTMLPLMAVNLLAAPTYASLWELRDIGGMRDKGREYSVFILLGTIPILLILLAAGKTILGWHGAEYVVSYIPLVIMLGGQLVNSGVGSTALLLNMTGHQDIVAMIFAPCAILNVIANAILIPSLGATGAAIATSVCLSIWNLALVVIIWKTLKLDTSWLNLLPGAKKRFVGQMPVFERR